MTQFFNVFIRLFIFCILASGALMGQEEPPHLLLRRHAAQPKQAEVPVYPVRKNSSLQREPSFPVQDQDKLPPFNPFEEGQDQNTEITNNSRFMAEFMKMLFFLGIIIAFMIIGSWFLKKMINTRLQQTNQQSSIQVIEQRALSSKSTLYLLNVEGQEILIAESPAGVVSLGQMKNERKEE